MVSVYSDGFEPRAPLHFLIRSIIHVAQYQPCSV